MSRIVKSVEETLRQLMRTAGPYLQWALAARKKYIDLRLGQDQEVRRIYIRAADKVAREIRRMRQQGYGNQMNVRYLTALELSLRQNSITEALQGIVSSSIEKAVEAGTSYSYEVTLSQISRTKLAKEPVKRAFVRANTQAVEACWARTQKGLYLSDRIWRHGEKARTVMTDIIRVAVATGEDPVETALALEKYVRRGSKTFAYEYPEMMERMGSRIPQDISYEALRLVRTETAAAFGEGTIAAANVSPSYTGMKWLLSNNSDPCHVCKRFAEADHGLGRGIWPPGEEPPMPAHPNCMCTLVSVHEDTDAFIDRLNAWMKNPASQPELEDWYQEVYSKVA
ncbi:retron-type reverse transcriptase [Paenibacillus thiaminolyticus]|uniref:retron-type reverse transcriptase n=1 Tax=Paenibacillus thiaminolyticus TaxID=49283 RepID=UPI003D2B6FC6